VVMQGGVYECTYSQPEG